jgi:hypothetical protein
MKTDYAYCLNKDSCIHRRGCKRWVGNYTEEEAINESNNNIYGYINDYDCINGEVIEMDVTGEPLYMPYIYLDRFRLSDGSEIK